MRAYYQGYMSKEAVAKWTRAYRNNIKNNNSPAAMKILVDQMQNKLRGSSVRFPLSNTTIPVIPKTVYAMSDAVSSGKRLFSEEGERLLRMVRRMPVYQQSEAPTQRLLDLVDRRRVRGLSADQRKSYLREAVKLTTKSKENSGNVAGTALKHIEPMEKYKGPMVTTITQGSKQGLDRVLQGLPGYGIERSKGGVWAHNTKVPGQSIEKLVGDSAMRDRYTNDSYAFGERPGIMLAKVRADKAHLMHNTQGETVRGDLYKNWEQAYLNPGSIESGRVFNLPASVSNEVINEKFISRKGEGEELLNASRLFPSARGSNRLSPDEYKKLSDYLVTLD
jgi:hypothetical protein